MTRIITLSLFAGVVLLSFSAHAQSVGIGTETPNSNAILELVAPNNDQGLLVPRLTTAQRTAATFTTNLSSADNGLMVFDSDLNTFFFWMNDQWVELATGNLNGLPDQSGQNGRFLTTDGTNPIWGDLDFNTLTNVPAGLNDGDDVDDADADASNELQDLSLATNILSLSGSVPTVDLSSYLDNTDSQDLAFAAGVITLSGDPDGTSIDLSNYDTDATDDFDGAFSSLSGIPTGLSDGDDVDDADNDATNEFQDLDLVGNTLSLTNSAVSIDLTPFAGTNTDNQTLSLVGTDLSITGGNTIDISSINVDQDISTSGAAGDITISGGSNLTLNVDDADSDPTNEDQTVSAGTGISVLQSGDDFQVTNTSPDQTVSITDGGNVTVTGTYPNFTLAVPTNLDNDPANEDQTVSAGTGISVLQSGDDFQVTNTSPDQTVSIIDGGNVTVTGTYPNFTLAVPTNLDNDPANEDQTVSAGTGISVLQSGDDFQVTNTSPDQTVSIADGGNVTVTGTYPNFTLAVPTNLDNDPANEDQTVSAGTGISVLQSGDDFQVTNTSPDQTVSITNGGNVTVTGTYPNFTLAVPTNNDNDATNEIELPDQTSNSGNFLTTDGSNPSWSAINESQWTTNGTSINYQTGNVNIGAGTIPTSRLQLSTNNANTSTPQLTIQESNSSSDASLYFNRSGTNLTMGIDATDGSFKMSSANALGSNDRLIMDSQGTVGIGVTPNAQFHVQTNSIESSTVRLTNTNSGAGSKIGILNELDNQGTSIKTGLWNDIDGTTGETGDVKSIYNVMNPTDGTTYGLHTQINNSGTGVRYGTFNDVRSSVSNSSLAYGFRANVDHDGTGDAFGIQTNMLGSTSGRQWGIYTSGEDFNFFEGNVGIGDVESDVELTVQGFDIGSTLPIIRVNSGSGTSDAGISYSVSGGNEFVVGVDATDGAFKISDGAALGSGERFTVDATGNVGINQTTPSARLDVVGTTELNGAVDVFSTLDVTGLVTVTNDIEIPNTNGYTYASAQTRYESYHPTELNFMAFDGGTAELVFGNFSNPYAYFANGSGALGYAVIPVKLPDNAVVTDLDVWVVDNDATASNFARVNLYRGTTGTIGTNLNMAQVETTTESASVQSLNDNTIFGGPIDNSLYNYRILFTARDNSSTLQLHGVQITYTVSEVD